MLQHVWLLSVVMGQDESTTIVSGWIFDENLRPFCEMVSLVSGYTFDDSDWAAFEPALLAPGTVTEPVSTLSYEFDGRRTPAGRTFADTRTNIVGTFDKEWGSSVVTLELVAENTSDARRLEMLIATCNCYRVT